MTTEEGKFLTPKEWGQKHGVPHNTVLNWVRNDQIPGVIKTKLPSGGWHYSIPEDAERPETKRGPKSKIKPLDLRAKTQVLAELRKFSGEKLSDEETEAILANHAKYFFDLAKTAHHKCFGPEQITWLDRLEYEHDNLRTALDYYSNKESAETEELEMAILLAHFWDVRGHWSEGRKRLQHALSRQQPGASTLKAYGLAWLGLLELSQDDYNEAHQTLSESVRMSKKVNADQCQAFAQLWLGFIAEARGQYTEANTHLNESLKLALKGKWIWLLAWVYRALGVVARAEGNLTAAKEHYENSLRHSERIQDQRETADTLNCLGVVARETGNYEESRRYHEKALMLAKGGGDRDAVSLSYTKLAALEEIMGRHQDAISLYQQALTLSHEIGNRLRITKCLEGIAKIAVTIGLESEAACILGAAHTLRSDIAAPLSSSEQKQFGEVISSTRKKFRSDWNKGTQWPLDEAITFALSLNQAIA